MIMTDFSQILNEEEIQTEGASGGGFTFTPPEEGVALLRLREVLEFGTVMGEYAGAPKEKKPVTLVFELTHPRHAITKEDGTFIRNHEVTVRLNKSNSDKSKYMKLFNKMNFDGGVATPKGKVPSFAAFLNKGFLGEIHHNPSKDGSRVYVNLDKDGEYTIGAPRVAEVDATLGTPTGNYNAVPVPEMTGEQRCFLWETGVSDEIYRAMWDSINIIGEKNDGTPFKNWIQDSILSEDNIALPGSRAEALFGKAAALDLSEPVDDLPFEADAPAADPLAALGL
jgi:hypothetical protein